MSSIREPWQQCTADFSAAVEKELGVEVPQGHPLFGVSVKAVAHRQDRDDILFVLQDDTERVAVVHLTYSAKQESNPDWPSTRLFQTYELWLSECMEKDAQEYDA